MEDFKVNICTHCNGWGVNHIPVHSKLEICDVCKGKAVVIESESQSLSWNDWTVSDMRPSVFTSKIINKENLKNLGLVALLFCLILWILINTGIVHANIFEAITNSISKILGIS